MHITADIHIVGAPVLCFYRGATACWITVRDSADPHGTHASLFMQNVAPEVIERAAAAFNAVIQESQISQAAE